MTLVEVENITKLARAQGLKASQADDAVERFRVGDVDIDENPWRTDALRTRIAEGAAEIDRYVKGQNRAKMRVLDILKRTSIGLTGAQDIIRRQPPPWRVVLCRSHRGRQNRDGQNHRPHRIRRPRRLPAL